MHPADEKGTRFRVLVPVWGERYIRDFCTISLPALLADGNLPELVRFAGCEIIFLTTRSSREFFESSEGIGRIRGFCAYTFVFIDDLLPLESYGIILTLAYGRGIASLGSLQTSTYFIFLNADFVLSNGTLRSVVDRIGKGYNAVMAPSLRCRQEDVVDDLQKRVSPRTGTLDAPPPELVRLTLDSLHITARASTVNQQISHHNAANQFFWRVDDDTLIGRFFLLFMLCIRPERPFTTALGWCDYTFVPDLVPSGNYDVITDSDDGFILEMQARRGDAHYVRSGRITPAEFAPRLSFWTTANHRDDAARTIVFHTGALPPHFEAVKAEADAFMAELFGHLKQPPTSHLNHPYWTSGLLQYQKNLAPNAMPPELPRLEHDPTAEVKKRWGEGTRSFLVRMLVAHPKRVGRMHFAYPDHRNFAAQIAAWRSQCGRPLHVREQPGLLDDHLAKDGPIETVALADLDALRSGGEPFDGVVITLMDYTLYTATRILRVASAHCTDGAPILLCVDAIDGVFFGGRFTTYLGGRLTTYFETIEILQSDLDDAITVEDSRMVTATERLAPVFRLVMIREILRTHSLSAWLAAAAVIPPALLRIGLANIRRKPDGPSSPGICTSATVRLRAPWQTMARALAERAARFDPAFYNRINTDVARAGVDPEAHFLAHGWREGRDPSAAFSVSGYRKANPDIEATGLDPWTHFRTVGLAEGRNGWQK